VDLLEVVLGQRGFVPGKLLDVVDGFPMAEASRCSLRDFPPMVNPFSTTSCVSCKVSVFPSILLLSYVYSMANASWIFPLSKSRNRLSSSLRASIVPSMFFSADHDSKPFFVPTRLQGQRRSPRDLLSPTHPGFPAAAPASSPPPIPARAGNRTSSWPARAGSSGWTRCGRWSLGRSACRHRKPG